MTPTVKTCFKCHQEKVLDEFYAHKMMADGHLNKCKVCTKKDVRSHRHGIGREHVLKYDRERASRPERRANARTVGARWRQAFPERRAAQIALGSAVKSGRVLPMPCLVCGEKAEAHHPDYSRPLDVVWLCPAHHKQLHAEAKMYSTESAPF